MNAGRIVRRTAGVLALAVLVFFVIAPTGRYLIRAAWAEEDRYFPLDEELAALRRAGFAEVECFWRRGDSAST